MLRSNVEVKHTYRFTSTSGSKTSISASDVVGIAGAVCATANTSLSYIAASARIHYVEIWSPPASQGVAATCSLEWTTQDAVQRSYEMSDTTLSVSVPAHVRTAPPRGSLAWDLLSSADTSVVMRMVAPAGSVIDVHVTHVLYDTQQASTTVAVAAGTLGALYYLPLDGVSDVYLPVSLGTTT